jgi:hypothetical protein
MDENTQICTYSVQSQRQTEARQEAIDDVRREKRGKGE